MGADSKIEWCDASWNPIVGCSVVSPGCTNCYAMGHAARIVRCANGAASHYDGTTQPSKAGPVWTSKVALAPDHILTAPLRWRRPRRIFVNSMGDLFHEAVPDAWIDRVFAVMALAPQHTFQVLTKRAKRMRVYMTGDWSVRVYQDIDGDPRGATSCGCLAGGKPLPNVWLGVSAEDQTLAEKRIPDLLETPAAVRWLSAEPLLGPIDFDDFRPPNSPTRGDPFPLTGRMIWAAARGFDDSVNACAGYTGKLDWVVVGGESGPGARPMHPQWARDIRDQCAAAGVPFFFKQWGEWGVDRPRAGGDLGGDIRAGRVRHVCAARENDGHFRSGDVHMRRVGKARAGRMLDGREHNDMPEVTR